MWLIVQACLLFGFLQNVATVGDGKYQLVRDSQSPNGKYVLACRAMGLANPNWEKMERDNLYLSNLQAKFELLGLDPKSNAVRFRLGPTDFHPGVLKSSFKAKWSADERWLMLWEQSSWYLQGLKVANLNRSKAIVSNDFHRVLDKAIERAAAKPNWARPKEHSNISFNPLGLDLAPNGDLLLRFRVFNPKAVSNWEVEAQARIRITVAKSGLTAKVVEVRALKVTPNRQSRESYSDHPINPCQFVFDFAGNPLRLVQVS